MQWSFLALYEKQIDISPKSSKNLSEAYTKNPAVIPIVVGKDAAHTPSLLIWASLSSTTARGDAQAKQAVIPGIKNYTWDYNASSETPLSNQI